MPTLTIDVTDHDLAQLGEMGGELGLTAHRMAQRLLHRTLARTVGKPLVTHRQRSSDRALRQLELLRILRRRRISTLGQAEKQALAKRFGVAERTIYRDLQVLERARALDAARLASGRASTDEDAEDTDMEGPDVVGRGSIVREDDTAPRAESA
jgi:hypothetical protein